METYRDDGGWAEEVTSMQLQKNSVEATQLAMLAEGNDDEDKATTIHIPAVSMVLSLNVYWLCHICNNMKGIEF